MKKKRLQNDPGHLYSQYSTVVLKWTKVTIGGISVIMPREVVLFSFEPETLEVCTGKQDSQQGSAGVCSWEPNL